MTWQAIATAPKDGTVIDVWLGEACDEDLLFYCGRDTKRAASWHWKDGKFRPEMGLHAVPVVVQPTHWMPLPAPPEATA